MSNVVQKVDFDEISLGKKVIEQEIAGLEALKSSLGEKFTQTVDLIFNTKGRVIVTGIGKSGHVCNKIAATLASTGTPAIFIHPSEASHGDLGMITEDDIVILLSNSGESFELNGIIDYCKRFSIPMVGFARKAGSTLMEVSDISFLLPDTDEASGIAAPTTSTTMMMALGDAIAVALQEKRGFTKADFKIFHPGGKIGAKLLKTKELMHTGKDMPIVAEDSTMMDAILEMTNKRLGCVCITDAEGSLKGIITDGDLRRHIDSDVKESKATDIMTVDPVTITQEVFASEALAVMNSKSITNLFVMEGKKPIGVLHLHDLLKAGVA